MTTDVMCDTIHDNVKEINPNGPFTHVAGYVSGSSDIIWTASDWNRFPKQIKIRIEQGYGSKTPDLTSYHVLDVESGAWTPQEAADEIERRVKAGHVWTTVYGTDSTIQQVGALVRAKGDAIWIGHVDCWLANWNLNQADAAKIVGTEVHGMTCRAVQWASPTSNPHTVEPGTTLTLKAANVDLSVVDVKWNPTTAATAVSPVKPPTPPTPPVHDAVPGFVTWINGGKLVNEAVTSTDAGVTWHK